jgi:hypothetical protein
MPHPEPKPFERCYWVVPGRLLAGCYPGELDEQVATTKLAGLLEVGVRVVVALTEAHESGRGGLPFAPYEPILRRLAEKRGLAVSVERHAIPDMGVPTTAALRLTLDAIDGAVAAGRPVYVHCWGGYGRTGTVVGCWLARHGHGVGAAALERLAALRRDLKGESPQTDAQRAMVTGWRPGE